MGVWWEELVSAVPNVLDKTLELGAGFVVDHLESDYMVTILETAHDRVVCFDAVLVLSVLEGDVKDNVGVSMIGNHDVLVAATGAEGGSASVVNVKFGDGFNADVDFIGTDSRKRDKRLGVENRSILGGADAFP